MFDRLMALVGGLSGGKTVNIKKHNSKMLGTL